MKILKIDNKWSIEYNPKNNDRPVNLYRYDEIAHFGTNEWTNEVNAMFYALLEAREALKPFAEAADDLDEKHNDYYDIWESPAAIGITAGNLRKARDIINVIS